MRKVVSNTTPLISLLKLSKLELLKELYKEISIPFAVFTSRLKLAETKALLPRFINNNMD